MRDSPLTSGRKTCDVASAAGRLTARPEDRHRAILSVSTMVRGVEPPTDSPGGGNRVLLNQTARFRRDQDVVRRTLTQPGAPSDIAHPEWPSGRMQCIQDVNSAQNRLD
jgi:hypothetical protein